MQISCRWVHVYMALMWNPCLVPRRHTLQQLFGAATSAAASVFNRLQCRASVWWNGSRHGKQKLCMIVSATVKSGKAGLDTFVIHRVWFLFFGISNYLLQLCRSCIFQSRPLLRSPTLYSGVTFSVCCFQHTCHCNRFELTNFTPTFLVNLSQNIAALLVTESALLTGLFNVYSC